MARAFPDWPTTARPSSLWAQNNRAPELPPLPPNESRDVLIVGAGFTGLWTAHFLTEIDPTLSVTVIDAMQPGHGASGRNGGWCSSLMPMSLDSVAERTSVGAAIALQDSLIGAVGHISTFISEHQIDCGWTRGGTLSIATNPAQLGRSRDYIESFRRYGYGNDAIAYVDSSAAEERIATGAALGGWYSPHCAVMDPMMLVNGLVRVLCAKGVRIHGHTRVTDVTSRTLGALTPGGPITASARWIVLATEAFTPLLKGNRRVLAPIHSYMVATERLPNEVWNALRWEAREAFSDGRHVVIYAQRTADDRIAFGGRGAPYAFGNGIGPHLDGNSTIHDKIVTSMHEIFPPTRDFSVTHRWGGALGVPRDWHTGVTVDRAHGLARAGGYVGDGVAFSRVAAEAMAHAILDTGEAPGRLPIVGHVSPLWEPEPLRWLGINAMLRVAAATDALETRESPLARFGERLLERLVH